MALLAGFVAFPVLLVGCGWLFLPAGTFTGWAVVDPRLPQLVARLESLKVWSRLRGLVAAISLVAVFVAVGLVVYYGLVRALLWLFEQVGF